MLPPNILFFLADDMGYGDPGYLAVGNKHGKLLTPNMDQMVAEGMSFTEAYAGAPVCAPSRCTLITGRHSGHCSVRNNGPSLGVNDVGFAEVLRSNGYHTRHIGDHLICRHTRHVCNVSNELHVSCTTRSVVRHVSRCSEIETDDERICCTRERWRR